MYNHGSIYLLEGQEGCGKIKHFVFMEKSDTTYEQIYLYSTWHVGIVNMYL